MDSATDRTEPAAGGADSATGRGTGTAQAVAGGEGGFQGGQDAGLQGKLQPGWKRTPQTEAARPTVRRAAAQGTQAGDGPVRVRRLSRRRRPQPVRLTSRAVRVADL